MGCEFLCSTLLCLGLGLFLYFTNKARREAEVTPPDGPAGDGSGRSG